MDAGDDAAIILDGVCGPVAGPREALARETMGIKTVILILTLEKQMQ